MTVSDMIRRVRRMTRGIENIADADIKDLINEEYLLLSDELNMTSYDAHRDITLDSIGQADVSDFVDGQIRTVALVEGA